MSEPELTHEQIIGKYLQLGDIITHTRCGGGFQEHFYTGMQGRWLTGRPTRDTFALEGMEGRRGWPENRAEDISPRNITHINRLQVSSLPWASEVEIDGMRKCARKAQ